MSVSFWLLLSFFGDNYLKGFRQDLITFYSYATSSSKIEPFKLNRSCKFIRGNLHAIFALSNNSSNRNKSQILFLVGKMYARWHFKIKIRVT